MAFSDKRAVIAVAIVGVVVVAAGGVAYFKYRSHEEEEDLTFDKAPKPESGAVKESGQGDAGLKGEYKHFLEYGFSLQLPADWEAVVDDFSLVGPQVAVIRIHPPGYEHSLPGALPSMSVIVEDIGREQMTLLAYKEKSKEYAMSMAGSGGLAMMGAQAVTKDASVSIGPFQHTLEYVQMYPDVQTGGHLPFHFMNLMTLHKGLAYVLQYMAREERYTEFFDVANTIAETFVIRDLPQRPASRLEFISQPHSLKVSVPETWSWVHENKDMGDGRIRIVRFLSGSSNKPDSISLYTLGKASSSAKALAGRYRDTIKVSAEVTAKEGDLAHFSYNADGKIVAVYCRKDYILECVPEGERITHHSQEDSVICAVLQSIASVRGVTQTQCHYYNTHRRIAFDIAAHGKLLEYKWGSTCVTYIPVSEEQEASIPVFSIEVNEEDEAYPNLQAVEAKIMASIDSNAPLKDKKVEVYRGREYLTFNVVRDEQMAVWGTNEEYQTKIFLALRGKESVMLKWEVPAREWQRYERYLTELLQSLEISP